MKKNPKEKRAVDVPFTLIELLSAMAILIIMMGVLFQFLVSAQRAWNATNQSTEVYESSRVFLSVLGRDLDSAFTATNDQNIGNNIQFRGANTSLGFFTYNTSSYADGAKVVKYEYVPDVVNAENDNLIKYHNDTSSSFSLYAAPDTLNNASPPIIAENVLSLEFTYLDDTYASSNTWNSTSLPAAVVVRFSILDSDNFQKWQMAVDGGLTDLQTDMENKARSFSKTFFLRK